ncbi:MAG TPA: hypothetical protein VL651_01065 [Bacteroidia bacterium]|jgi:hypothetical protein|nr:hypothetical protein [Bacteroidia bacterium]
MALFKANPGEKTLHTSRAFWNKSKMMAYLGTLHITDQRVVYEKDANLNTGILVQLLVKSTRARIVMDMPLASINKVVIRRKKALVGQKEIVRFTFEGNGTSLTVQPDNYEEVFALVPNQEEVPWKEA